MAQSSQTISNVADVIPELKKAWLSAGRELKKREAEQSTAYNYKVR